MDNGSNVIYIIGGDESDLRDHNPIAASGYECGVGSGGDVAAKMFYKTEICREVLLGRICHSDSNCYFAHSIEEIRNPEQNYQEFGCADKDTDRTYKIRHCNKFYSESGCPLGEKCSFRHDELFKGRETTTILLGPGYGIAPAATPPPLAPLPPREPLGPPPPLAPLPQPKELSPLTLKPKNWRTRICKKWEYSGFCHFGSRCMFAHGEEELQHFGGGLVNPHLNNQGLMHLNVVAGAGSSAARVVAAPGSSLSRAGGSERPSGAAKRPWKGPDKISRIYGDWID